MSEQMTQHARVARLTMYPVKSCQGIDVDTASFDANGMMGDRMFMVVDSDGAPVTQLKTKAIARIRTALTAEELRLDAGDHGQIAVPLELSDRPADIASALYGSVLNGQDQGSDAAQWLSDFLGKTVRLLRVVEPFTRQLPIPGFEPVHGQQRNNVTDAGPVLIANLASLAELNARLDEPVGIDRFRANIVLDGCSAFAEDGFSRARGSELEFLRLDHCERCAVTNTDQITGERGHEPWRTLRAFRHREPGYAGGVMFGAYALPAQSGHLTIGEQLNLQ